MLSRGDYSGEKKMEAEVWPSLAAIWQNIIVMLPKEVNDSDQSG